MSGWSSAGHWPASLLDLGHAAPARAKDQRQEEGEGAAGDAVARGRSEDDERVAAPAKAAKHGAPGRLAHLHTFHMYDMYVQ